MQTTRVVILAARGGMGKTCAAAGIALACAARGHRTALIDLDLTARALDACLGCEDRVIYDLGDLLDGGRDVMGVAIPLADRLWLIPGAYRADMTPEASCLEDICRQITEGVHADVLVVDTASSSDPATRALAARADYVPVVSTPHPRAIGATASMAAHLPQRGIENAYLLINRLPLTRSGCDLRGMIDTTALPLLGVIPAHEDMDRRLLLSEATTVRDSLAIAFSNIAARLTGDAVPLLDGVIKDRRAYLSV